MAMIPWPLLLRHAPLILKAANDLYSHVMTPAEKPSALDDRLAALEQQAQDSAQLSREIAQQLQALTLAQAALMRRLRVAIAISVAAGVLALVVLVLLLLDRA